MSKIKKKAYPVFIEIIPLLLFFILSKYSNIFIATGVLAITSFLNLIACYLYTKQWHIISVITTILAVVFGGLTVFLNNDSFIKIKVTLINLIFSIALASGYIFKKNYLKWVFHSQIKLSNPAWNRLTCYWIFFFLFLAILNELIWRNFSTSAWVNFKVFGILGLTFSFLLLQYPFLKKYKINKDK